MTTAARRRLDYPVAQIEALLGRFMPHYQQAFRAAIRQAREGIHDGTLRAALERQDVEAALNAIPLEGFTASLLAASERTFLLAMAAAARETPLPVRKAKPPRRTATGALAARFNLTNPRAVEAARRYSYGLVTNVTAETRTALRNVIEYGQRGLATVDQQARRIRDLVGLDDVRAGALGRFEDGLREGGDLSEAQITSRVARQTEAYLADRAETIARTECLLPETPVDAAVVRAVFRRWYVGDVAEIHTRDGRQFTATPNHPMLTTRGWVAAGLLREGDDLICDSRQQSSRAAGEPDVQRYPTTLAQLFDAALAIGVLERRCTGDPDFHGDGREGEVEIAHPNRMLRVGDFAALNQPALQDVFPESGMARARFCASCAGLLPVYELQHICARAKYDPGIPKNSTDRTTGQAERSGETECGFSSEVTGDNSLSGQRQQLRMTAPASIEGEPRSAAISADARFTDGVARPIGGDVHGARDSNRTQPAAIELDSVLSVRRREWSGHVYNIESPDGYFNVNGVYTGNTIRALNTGQSELWAQAQEAGLLGADASRVWIAEPTACEICADLDGTTVGLDEPWTASDGEEVDGPPKHPRCMCGQGIVDPGTVQPGEEDVAEVDTEESD